MHLKECQRKDFKKITLSCFVYACYFQRKGEIYDPWDFFSLTGGH